MKKIIYISIILMVNISFSQKLKVQGNWNQTFSSAHIKEAGSDYNDYYESKKNQSKIFITPIPNSWYNNRYMPFKVYVHKIDDNWHPNLNLEVKVSSKNKHGNTSGTQYKQITNYSSLFFETVGKRSNIPIKYRISGVSVTIPADTYTVEIVYTVLNL